MKADCRLDEVGMLGQIMGIVLEDARVYDHGSASDLIQAVFDEIGRNSRPFDD